MKLVATWDTERKEETKVKLTGTRGHHQIEILDFLKDTIYDVQDIYNKEWVKLLKMPNKKKVK